MESVIQYCLGSICVLTPLIFMLWAGLVYGLGIGSIRIPGIGRQEMTPGKEWTKVPDLTRKVSEAIAAIFSLVGTLFGLFGFLLPWVRANIGAGAELFDLGNLSGTLSGIALAFQSMVAGIGLFSVDIEGARGLGFSLILVSLMVWLIPVALVLSAAIGTGLISMQLGLIKAQFQRLARGLLVMSVISLCLSCAFFAGIQATVGGIKVGGSEGLFGTSLSMGVEIANGFWVTVGGLVLALFGAIMATTLATSLENWAKNLTDLEKGTEEEEKNAPA